MNRPIPSFRNECVLCEERDHYILEHMSDDYTKFRCNRCGATTHYDNCSLTVSLPAFSVSVVESDHKLNENFHADILHEHTDDGELEMRLG